MTGGRRLLNRRHFMQSSLAAAVAYALPTTRLFALDQAASQAAGGLAAVTAFPGYGVPGLAGYDATAHTPKCN